MSTIAPNDTNLLYSPANWLVTAGTAKTANPGAYIRASITGGPTSLTATFNMASMNTADPSHVGFRVDGGSWQIAPCAASMPITLPSSNSWTTHQVELVMVSARTGGDRWAGQDTAIVFTGFASPQSISTRPVRGRPFRGMIFGDSITEGIKTRTGTTGTAASGSALVSYSYPLGDALGADVGIVGWSGQGIVNGGGGGVPNFQSAAPFLWQGQPRDLSLESLDFITCHIGTNDGSQADADVTAGTAALLNYLLGSTSSGMPVIVFPGWLETKKAAIQAGINACTSPSRVTMIDTAGWWSTADASDGLHPYGYINLSQLAPRAAAAVHGVLSAGNGSPSGESHLFQRAPWGEAVPVYSGQ